MRLQANFPRQLQGLKRAVHPVPTLEYAAQRVQLLEWSGDGGGEVSKTVEEVKVELVKWNSKEKACPSWARDFGQNGEGATVSQHMEARSQFPCHFSTRDVTDHLYVK